MGRRNDFEDGGEYGGRKREETKWLLDEKGREYKDTGTGRLYRTQEDRDSALEERYRARCDCHVSVLAEVAAHGDELVAEYMQWTSDHHGREAFRADNLYEWEVSRWGDRLYQAAHAAFMYRVKIAIFGEPQTRRKTAPALQGGPQDMPSARPMSDQKWNAGLNAARQAEARLPYSEPREPGEDG